MEIYRRATAATCVAAAFFFFCFFTLRLWHDVSGGGGMDGSKAEREQGLSGGWMLCCRLAHAAAASSEHATNFKLSNFIFQTFKLQTFKIIYFFLFHSSNHQTFIHLFIN
jgi:hypothetical protein